MSYITATQLLGAHAVAAKATAHFHHTGESAHPDTNTTFFPAPNHRLRNNNNNNERPVKQRRAKKDQVAAAYHCKFMGPRFPAPIARAVKRPEETPKRTDCGCEHCLAFYAANGLQHGVAAVVFKKSALNAAVAEFVSVKKPALNAAVAEFVPAIALASVAANAAAAEFVPPIALAGVAANAAAALVTEAPVITETFDIKILWDDSTHIEVASHPTALLAPIVTKAPEKFNIRSLWDDSTYIEVASHPTALFAPIVSGLYSWPCGPFPEDPTPTPTPIAAPRPVRPLAASIQKLEKLTDRNAAANRRSSTSTNVSAGATVFDDDAADETSSATTTATDSFRQLSEHDVEQTALEYGIDLEELEMQGRELIGWELLIEEEL